MKFGIWVEPERVDLQTVGKAGLAKERWLATQSGPLRSREDQRDRQRGSTLPRQSEARDWILGRLSALIDAAHPDYLKWDNNFWVNCTRSGHGHGSDDGNFTHVSALRAAARDVARPLPRPADRELLRRRQPPRAEHAGFSDTAWMDDRSSSAPHVRHNLQGLSTLMPPSSLLSFVFGNEWEGDGRRQRSSQCVPEPDARHPRRDLADRRTERRVAQRHAAGDRDLQGAPRRAARPERSAADAAGRRRSGRRMGRAAGELGEHRERRRSSPSRIPAPPRRPRSVPRRSRSDTLYDVVSVDVGSIGEASGDELMSSGITIFSSPGSRAHVLQLRPIGAVGGRGVIAPRAPTFSEAALFARSTLPSWKKVCIMNS